METALKQVPGIREALVLLREDNPGDKRLVAYLVAREGTAPGVEALLRHLEQTLPDYMVPAAFVWLASMPVNPAGKVDRKALPAPEAKRTDRGALVDPRDAVELEVARIWEDVLAVRPVGVRDDFFALGGHSLLAVRLLTRLHERFGRVLPLSTLLRSPTVEAMALKLREQEAPRSSSPLVTIQPGGPKRPSSSPTRSAEWSCAIPLSRATWGPIDPAMACKLRASTTNRSRSTALRRWRRSTSRW